LKSTDTDDGLAALLRDPRTLLTVSHSGVPVIDQLKAPSTDSPTVKAPT
jgi:hypothetical protein